MGAHVVPTLVHQARLRAGDAVALAEGAFLVLFPQGGQGASRHNARLATAREALLASARRESEEALGAAWGRRGAPLPPVAPGDLPAMRAL